MECDYCTDDYLKELAVVYQQMKAIDPYHLTAGALECGEMHAFQEPQLSLDAPMRENYRPDLAFHANNGVIRGVRAHSPPRSTTPWSIVLLIPLSSARLPPCCLTYSYTGLSD